MAVSATFAAWCLPFVLPLCLYVCFTDMARMKITNRAVLALAAIFVVLGAIFLPMQLYLWHLGAMVAVLGIGIVLNAAGVMGAGDAKFIAAAAPFVALADLRILMTLFMAILVAAFIAHRGARATPLRRLAPDWQSWHEGRRFPMGLALGPTLAVYLTLGALYGTTA